MNPAKKVTTPLPSREGTGDGLFWTELSEVFFSSLSLSEKYALLYGLLDRVCTELTAGLTTHYNGLFTRLQALCRIKGHPLQAVDMMRWRARQVKLGEYAPNEVEWLQDTRALCDALSCFTDSKISPQLLRVLPDHVTPTSIRMARHHRQKCQRFVAVARDDQYVYARTADDPSADLLHIDYSLNEHTMQTAQYIEADMQFNCVALTVGKDDIYYPTILILDPDYLIDVSSLTACVRPYGSSPFNYLLKKFEAKPQSSAILLGHVANQMLDDCVHRPQVTYEESLQRAFRNHILDFCTAEGIDERFFEECRSQFDHIRQTVKELQLPATDALLEPSFFCESLGLQGRFDLLSADYTKLVELKSGKWNEARRTVQREHLLQMLLYKEILYYNLGIRQNDCAGYLFYSRYPYLLEQRSAQQLIQEVMTLRNRIVVLERWLCDGRFREFLPKLSTDALWQDHSLNESYWERYFKPPVAAIIQSLQTMDPLLEDYFHTFLQFIEREQMMAKVGDSRIESTRGMASLWNADADLKRENGDLLTHLQLCDTRDEDGLVETLVLKMDDAQNCQPNFRAGDAVILYERENEQDNACHHRVERATVEKIERDTIYLRLRQPHPLPVERDSGDRSWAVEHDYVESSFRSLYGGLFALVQADPQRRALLLGQRNPSADDFQLIVGPPGTGKTSVALRQLVVQELCAGHRVMLCAYTNRAVDEICEMLERLRQDKPSQMAPTGYEYVRIGQPLSCDERFRPHLLENLVQNYSKRKQIIDYLQRTMIYVGTVTSLTSHINLLQLAPPDLLVVDEASQILEPQLLPLLCAHRGKFVLIGDHKQLPAVVAQPEHLSEVHSEPLRAIGLTNCRNSLFQRLYNHASIVFLNRQGRMHPAISQFASNQFYGGRLDIVPLPHQLEDLPYAVSSSDAQSPAIRRVCFIDVPPPTLSERSPKMNQAEAETIARLVADLIRLHRENSLPFSVSAQVGIIVPFRRQITAVRHALLRTGITEADDMLIDTVERYQGSQKDIIIYGTTVSRPYELELLSNIVVAEDGILVDRKLNVAATRARQQFFLVGSRQLLIQNPLYAALIHFIERS